MFDDFHGLSHENLGPDTAQRADAQTPQSASDLAEQQLCGLATDDNRQQFNKLTEQENTRILSGQPNRPGPAKIGTQEGAVGMKPTQIHAGVKALLEFGPIIGFLIAYLVLKDDSFVLFGAEYTGFVAVTAMFIPVFLLGIALLWYLTGRPARVQVVTTVMLVIFGGLGAWMNDPKLIKIKPTAVYLALALILGIGLLRGQSWLKFIMEEMIPLKEEGWMILTKRVTFLFVLSAAANEIVWRTQTETFWVFFETLAMPVVIFLFFLSQIPLFVDYATLASPKKKS